MSNYSITPLSAQMLVKNNASEITFSVANTTDKLLQTRFDLGLDVQAPAKKEWLQLETKPCNIPPKGTVQVIVKMLAPTGTKGDYHFRIVAATAPRTDEDFTIGPTISFTLDKTAAPTPTPFHIKWWMILIACVVVLAIAGGVLAVVLNSHGGGIPDVVDKKSDEAKQLIEKAGFKAKVTEAYYPSKDSGIVQRQVPGKGDAVPEDKIIVLYVSSALASVPCIEGMQVFDAVNKLRAAGLDVGSETYTSDGTAANNSVVTQNPRNEVCTPHPNGLRVAPSSKVNIQIKRQQ
jgi:hypothetical protein